MLRFICNDPFWSDGCNNFNTSHVTVYLWDILHPFSPCHHFNTSHVTVYQALRGCESLVPEFQYISCYGLSRLNARMQRICTNFNTSHVTVYPWKMSGRSRKRCYFNTSHVTVYLNLNYLVVKGKGFQYISCYGLSNTVKTDTGIEV